MELFTIPFVPSHCTAPPLAVALLLLNVELNRVPLSPIQNIAPPWVALFFVKIEFETILWDAPWYIAPPLVAWLFMNVESVTFTNPLLK